MQLIDTHCHLYSTEFTADIDEVITRAQQQGVKKFYLPAIDSSTHASMLQLQQHYPSVCIAMMGLHPCSVGKNFNEELAIVRQYLTQHKFVAVGEIGLDFYWDTTFAEEQKIVFHQQIELALQYQLPIVIHTRKAMQETISIVKQYTSKGLGGIFHCFSGSYEEAVKIIDAGFYLGIGGVVTYKNAGLAQVLQKIHLKHLVLETDAPYLTPVPFRGKRNESAYLTHIIEKIAAIKNCSTAEVAEVTCANANTIFTY
jgi:TatD DNase family protein